MEDTLKKQANKQTPLRQGPAIPSAEEEEVPKAIQTDPDMIQTDPGNKLKNCRAN